MKRSYAAMNSYD